MMSQSIGEVVLNEADIQRGVLDVAQQLNTEFSDVVIITVVPGGILFTADLVRNLTIDVSMDYISCPHSPGERSNSSQIIYHQNIDIKAKDVIVVDDAIESGGTMKRLITYLAEFCPRSLATATLLVKPGRISIPVKQFYAYELDTDELLVGYGLPWQDKLRNVPYVAKLIK